VPSAGSDPRALLVAFHFPPAQGSSGLQRTLSLARDLPSCGWQPLVLSAHRRAYPRTSDQQLADIPDDVPVSRAFALDTARHFSLRGIHFRSLAVPDRWWPWWFGGVVSGLRLIRRQRPAVIWSTAPIPTAHLIAHTLARISGLPWVADIRDLMTEPDWPKNPLAWRLSRWIETRAVTGSRRAVVVSPGQREAYLNRFPDLDPERIAVVPNGYDEAAFRAAEADLGPASAGKGRLRLVHSGLLYPRDRNPRPFLEALAALMAAGTIAREEIEVVLRASGSEKRFAQWIQELGLEGVVALEPALGYRDALAEMMAADGLLLFQGRRCHTAIPAKLYEYMRAGTPVLALADPDSATGRVLTRAGYPHVVPLESRSAIEPALTDFLAGLRSGTAFRPGPETVRGYSREAAARALARIFHEATGLGQPAIPAPSPSSGRRASARSRQPR